MQTLYECHGDTKIVLLTTAGEVDSFLTQLERIAAELSWQPGDQIRDCAQSAVHLTTVVGNKIGGGLQIVVEGGNTPLPCRSVWPEVDTTDALAAHITILALEKQHRGKPGLFWPLCVELWRWCKAGGIQTLLLEATPPTLRVYRRMGWPLEIIGDLRRHWGEECYLCRAGLQQMEEVIAFRASKSQKYRAIVQQGHRGRK